MLLLSFGSPLISFLSFSYEVFFCFLLYLLQFLSGFGDVSNSRILHELALACLWSKFGYRISTRPLRRAHARETGVSCDSLSRGFW